MEKIPTWYEKIAEDIKKKNQNCFTWNGLGWSAKVPENPYSYRNWDVYSLAMDELHGNKSKACVRTFRHRVPRTTDRLNRYYNANIRDKHECAIVKGVWDPIARNRNNKYSKGVCWTSKEQQQCSALTKEDLIIPELRKENPDLKGSLTENKSICESQPNCKWHERLDDCIDKSSFVENPKINAEIDTEIDIPRDITSEESRIQKYLYDWYTSDTPSAAPKTDVLEGEGNRCVENSGPNAIGSTDEMILKERTMYHLEDLKKVSFPLSRNNAKWLGYAIGKLRVQGLTNFYKIKAERERREFKNTPQDEVLKLQNKKIIDVANTEIEKIWSMFSPDDLYKGIDDIESYENYYEFNSKGEDKKIGDIKKTEKVFLPSKSQSIVNQLMKSIQNPESTNRGLIAWHSTGSGKTCTATGVMEAFWNSSQQIIFASSKDAVASNPPQNFHLCASRLFPLFSAPPFNKDVQIIANHFENREISFLSFPVLANRIAKMGKIKTEFKNYEMKQIDPSFWKTTGTKIDKVASYISLRFGVAKDKAKQACIKANVKSINDIVDLDNAVLILDEVHNLFRPIANQKKLYAEVEKHITIPKIHPKLKIVIMTATPGDNVTDVMKLVNSVRDPTNPEIRGPNQDKAEDIKRFKNEIRGLISFFDMSGDSTKFPRVIDNGPIKYPMSKSHFAQYVEKYKEVKDGMKNYDRLAKDNQLNKYWQSARKYSNMVYNFDKTMALTEFSSKLPALLDKIQLFPREKQYCYSAFYTSQGSGQGILEIGRQMDELGYKKFTLKEAKDINRSGKKLLPAKRYILVIQKEFGEEGSTSAGKNLHELLKIYNSPENKNGELIHVMLASQGFNEGLDLKDVRHIHIFEPLVTMASDLQTIGRARRNCSHANLDQKDWNVHIHRYMSDFPIESVEDSLEFEQKDIEGIIYDLESKLTSTKDKKPLKDELSKHKKRLTEIKKARKSQASAKDIKNIDEEIYREAQDRMRELFTIYNCMKEASVDCMILKDFHKNRSIHCMDEI